MNSNGSILSRLRNVLKVSKIVVLPVPFSPANIIVEYGVPSFFVKFSSKFPSISWLFHFNLVIIWYPSYTHELREYVHSNSTILNIFLDGVTVFRHFHNIVQRVLQPL